MSLPKPTRLLLGELQAPKGNLGFSRQQEAEPHGLVSYNEDGHLVTIAPTRTGKGRDVIIPNLLHYEGPVVCVDPKGENLAVCGKRRRQMGHRVVKLDPFGVVDQHSDSLNPFDIFSLHGADLETDSQMLAELITRGIKGTKEPFWDLSGGSFLSGLICYAASQGDPAKANLNMVMELLSADDIAYSLALLLDAKSKEMNRFAYREIAAVLQLVECTRSGIIATALSYLKGFQSPRIANILKKSSFALQSIVDGDPVDVFIVIPPNRLASQRALLKLQVATLLAAVLSRRQRPKLRTLFLLDEVAQLETFTLLETMVTLAGGYGAWVWMFLQDLAQLQSCYKTSWKTLLNNCGSVQVFGINNRDMATQWSGYLEHGPHQLQALGRDEQVVLISGQGEYRCHRLNYLTDKRFAGRFDENPLYLSPKPDRRGQPKPLATNGRAVTSR